VEFPSLYSKAADSGNGSTRRTLRQEWVIARFKQLECVWVQAGCSRLRHVDLILFFLLPGGLPIAPPRIAFQRFRVERAHPLPIAAPPRRGVAATRASDDAGVVGEPHHRIRILVLDRLSVLVLECEQLLFDRLRCHRDLP
jgi:hypothetical protein